MKVCDCCFRDEEIKRYIVSTSTEKGICECCSEDSNIIEINELLDFFSEFLSIFKHDEKGSPLIYMVQHDWSIFTSIDSAYKILSTVISKLKPVFKLDIDSEISIDINIGVSYIDEIVQSVSYWETLKEDLKWKRRFLTDLDEMIELGWDASFNVISILDSTTPLYRARLNLENQGISFRSNEMGSPIEKLTSAGRANPQGIPYLYLSKSLDTTLYETRATFLDNISIGVFRVLETSRIELVDFTGKQSPFNNMGDILNFTKGKLIRNVISRELSKPLRRYDSELEYIPTQFICEFIRYITGADGIQFFSSLVENGENVVLFNQEKINCTEVELHQITKVEIQSKRIS